MSIFLANKEHVNQKEDNEMKPKKVHGFPFKCNEATGYSERTQQVTTEWKVRWKWAPVV